MSSHLQMFNLLESYRLDRVHDISWLSLSKSDLIKECSHRLLTGTIPSSILPLQILECFELDTLTALAEVWKYA